MSLTVFVVDTYSSYEKNSNVRKIFNYNNRKYCIKEVEMYWGVPQLCLPIEDTSDVKTAFKIYDTFEEANKYVESLIGAKL